MRQKGAPILIRQYLKLGGRLLGFNVDYAFGDCIDSLILADLRETEPQILQRYMGREKTQRFLAYHENTEALATSTQVALRNEKHHYGCILTVCRVYFSWNIPEC